MYTASKELIEILKKNGFKDKSYQYLPDFGKKYEAQKDYTPARKKVFGMGHGKRKTKISFDYASISVSERGVFITEQYIRLDECQLRSIITFFKCSYARQKTLIEHCSNRIETAGNLMKQDRNNGICHPPFDKKFEQIYNSIKC